MNTPRIRSAGVTLIELVITIALTGILAALIVQFVAPVRGYIDSSRRAALADTADTALRRIGRDVRLALPNSVRVDTGTGKYLEFLPVRTGGRYRSESDPADNTNTCPTGSGTSPADNMLSFGDATETCFRSIGGIPNIGNVVVGPSATDGDFLVVFNLQPGTDGNADAYQFSGSGGNKAKIASGTAGTLVKFASNTFTYESPGNRFFIIEGPVTYGCDTSAQTLTRYWGYAISSTQSTPPTGGSSALLASGVTDCAFTYDTSVTSQGAGLVTMRLRLTMQDSRGDSESVNLYHAVHVNNVP